MIFGRCIVADGTVETHNDDYALATVTAVSCRRPFLAPALLIGAGLAGFSWAFADLLYTGEIAFLAVISCIIIWAGQWLGQLKLLSRDLRGSDLDTALWGSYRALTAKRREITRALPTKPREVR